MAVIKDIGKRGGIYKITLQGVLSVNTEFKNLSQSEFLSLINEDGLMYSEVFVHCASISDFHCLDEFMYYSRLIQMDSLENIEKFPFKKENNLSQEEFKNDYKLYFNEIFLEGGNELINISFEDFIEGYYYFNEPSVIAMGCKLKNQFWGFVYNPYI
jgi:hypothetical protein